MIRIGLMALAILIGMSTAQAQTKDEPALYNPKANAAADLRAAQTHATKEGKQILLQIGGNWCTWCMKLDRLFRSNRRIDSLLKADYVFVHVNYSKENMNEAFLATLGFPQRFGFPVLVILDSKGNRLHTQDSGLLESNGAHDPDKVMTVLSQWTRAALDPGRYSGKKK